MVLRKTDLTGLPTDAHATFGGKACGLTRLISAGAKVPAGFAIEATTLLPDEWSEAEREAFRSSAEELLKAGRHLAVRSSAVGEDSAERSFAGLFETVLGAGTPKEALADAARCIASGRSTRVLEYAKGQSPLAVGVVVQTLVKARVAGVCFTRDPTGKDGAVVIEAVEGLGDKLVAGAVTPELWRVYRSGLGNWESHAEDASVILDAAEAGEIAAQSTSFARHFQAPLDLEWAIDDAGTLWWLQARPITAAANPPNFVIQRSFEGVDDGPVTVWSNWNVRETLPDPMYPLTWTVWRDVVIPMATHQLFGISESSPLIRHMLAVDLVHGRIYFNMNGFLAVPLFGSMASRVLAVADSRALDIMNALTSTGVLRPRALPGSRVGLSIRIIAASALSLLRLASGLMPRRALRILDEDGTAISRRENVSGLSNLELIEEIHLFVKPECRRIRYGLRLETVAMGVYEVARRAFRNHPRALGLLASGIPANPTTQISIFIDQLSEAARPLSDIFLEALSTEDLLKKLEAAPEGLDWLSRFQIFLDRFGHRGPMEFDMGSERWSEDPRMILDLIRENLRSPAKENLRERMARLAGERSDAVGEAAAKAPIWRAPIMRALARLVELYMPLREAPKHYGVLVFQRMRQAAQELGKRLASDGIVNSSDDVFFLELPELQALAQGKRLDADIPGRIGERKEQFSRFKTERAPGFLRSDGVPVIETFPPEATDDGTLRGTPVSAGQAAGPVRILREPDPQAMSEGDIIVMEFADPGWTPLFPRASAVVMEVGGLMCHAAVVAREMGIPAVFGVSDVTSILADGQRVCVDGTLGIVTPD